MPISIRGVITLRILTTDKVIERSTFDSESSCLLDKIAKSSPSCFIYEGLSLDKYLPSHDSNSNLAKLAKVLPNASQTIRNYLKKYFQLLESRNRNTRKKISFIDVVSAFASEEHIKVINAKIAGMDYREKLPWLITGQQFSVAEYLFMHTLSLCRISLSCNNAILVGIHPSGILLNGLHFQGSRQFLSKVLKGGFGIVHFATVVTITNNSTLIEKIKKIQSIGIYNELIKSLSGRVIDFANSGGETSVLRWTKNRFEKT